MPGRNPPFLILARIGFAARGLMYLLVAWLAIRVGRTEDAGRALSYLGSGGGRAVLAAMALGFAAYAAWRLADAAFDSEGYGKGPKGIGHRIAAMGSGLVHSALAFTSAKLALGAGSSSGGSSRTAEAGAATAMHLPGGPLLLYAAAAGLAGAAVFQLAHGLRLRFLKHMEPGEGRKWWVKAAGAAGYTARGIVFGVAAYLMFRAAADHRPGEAGGLGDALEALPGMLRRGVAAGLALFGLFSILEGRYRVMRDPKLKDRVKDAAGA